MKNNFKITLSSLHEEPTKYLFDVCLVTPPHLFSLFARYLGKSYVMEKGLGCIQTGTWPENICQDFDTYKSMKYNLLL